MKEYFVKYNESGEAHGPYTIDALRDLAESGKLSPQNFIYDENKDAFVLIDEDPDLWKQIEPPKKIGLQLKKKSEPAVSPSLKKTAKNAAAPVAGEKNSEVGRGLEESVELDKVLAAAEGRTAETQHIKRPSLTQQRAAQAIIPGMMIAILVFLSAVIGAYFDTLSHMFVESDYRIGPFFENWILIFAVVDLVLMIVIGLGQTSVFPFLRFRACLGIGFFLFLYYTTLNWDAMIAITAYQAGLFGATLTVRFLPTLLFLTLSVAGAGYFSYLFWTGNALL